MWNKWTTDNEEMLLKASRRTPFCHRITIELVSPSGCGAGSLGTLGGLGTGSAGGRFDRSGRGCFHGRRRRGSGSLGALGRDSWSLGRLGHDPSSARSELIHLVVDGVGGGDRTERHDQEKEGQAGSEHGDGSMGGKSSRCVVAEAVSKLSGVVCNSMSSKL